MSRPAALAWIGESGESRRDSRDQILLARPRYNPSTNGLPSPLVSRPMAGDKGHADDPPPDPVVVAQERLNKARRALDLANSELLDAATEEDREEARETVQDALLNVDAAQGTLEAARHDRQQQRRARVEKRAERDAKVVEHADRSASSQQPPGGLLGSRPPPWLAIAPGASSKPVVPKEPKVKVEPPSTFKTSASTSKGSAGVSAKPIEVTDDSGDDVNPNVGRDGKRVRANPFSPDSTLTRRSVDRSVPARSVVIARSAAK